MAKNKKRSFAKKKQKRSGKNKEKMVLTREVLRVLDKNFNQAHNHKQIAASLEIKDKETRDLIQIILTEQTRKGRLVEVSRGKYKFHKVFSNIEGTVCMTLSGAAFVSTTDIEEDIFIAPKNQLTALHGDKVRVHLFARKRGRSPEGEILEVLERAREEFVGRVEISENYAFLIPDSTKMSVDLYIPLSKLNGAEHGQKAVARMTSWPKEASSPFGRIVEVLGDAGDNNTEMGAILANQGFPLSFPTAVEEAAAAIPTAITREEVNKRRDFRTVTTFTIDPRDAKDFDDALSIQKLPNGNWEIGVHIADVTHYVRENTAIEREALERATSVYLVDRVIPMLPEVLSNNVCSLRPKEDKLCFSAVFELNENAQVQKRWFGRTVIHSDRRFTYEEAQEILEGNAGDFESELRLMNDLAKVLRKGRMNHGAIAFERVEVRFGLDEQGSPAEVYFKESKDANKLIEEFMLLANREVATFIGQKRDHNPAKTFVYRVHDQPDFEKIKEFDRFIRQFGYRINTGSPTSLSKSINELLKEVKGKPEENMIETLAIRTMAKAFYSTENVGHYGLAFGYYSHFTSPIRRYPDMMVHRLLQHYLDGGASAGPSS